MFAFQLLQKPVVLIIIYHCVLIKSCCAHNYRLGDNDDDLKKSIEEIAYEYEDDKNSMLALNAKEKEDIYEDFYDESDNRLNKDKHSMNIIFFGDPMSFLRLDPESIMHILSHTKTHLVPRSRAILAWDIITDGKTAAYLQHREYLAFGKLLNVIPEEDLFYVNFADASVLKFFARQDLKLERRKLGILASAYRRYYGKQWYLNGTYISELGYLLCGFPAADLKMISPQRFKDTSWEAWKRISTCSTKQLQALYEVATHNEAYGAPYSWTSHEIAKLSTLLSCVPDEEISSIRLEAMAAISEGVMKDMDQVKLTFFTREQILRMAPKTRRIFMLRMQLKSSMDVAELVKKRSSAILPSTLVISALGISLFIFHNKNYL